MIWYYVFDNMFWTPSLPNFCHKKHFFSIFWHGVTSPPPISTMSTNILFFFWGYPLVGVSNSDSESSSYPSTNSPGNTGSWSRWVCTLFIFTLLYYCITSICCTSSSCTTSSVVFPFVRSVPPFHSGIVAPSWLGYIF